MIAQKEKIKVSFMENVRSFFKPFEATYTDINQLICESNSMLELIRTHQQTEHGKNDPITVQIFGVDYVFVDFLFEEGNCTIQLKRYMTDDTFILPTTFAGLDTLHTCLMNYCVSRSLFR